MRRLLADDVTAFLPIVSAKIELGGQPAEVYGVTDHSTYRDHWPLLEAADNVWDRLQEPETCADQRTVCAAVRTGRRRSR